MADTKISDETILTKDGTERIPVIQSDGSGGWINGALPITDFGGGNFATSDLTLTADRSHDFDNFSMSWIDIKEFTATSATAPSIGNASFTWLGYGTLNTDVTHRFSSSSGVSFEIYGDESVRFYNKFQVDGRVVVGYDQASLSDSTWGHTFAAPAGSSKAFTVGTTGLTSDLFNMFANGQWMIGALSGPTHSMGRNADNHYIFNSSGKGLLIGADNDSVVDCAIVEIRSTSRGFLGPKMTTAQMMAITSLTPGLEVYVTDVIEGKYIYKSSGWTFLG